MMITAHPLSARSIDSETGKLCQANVARVPCRRTQELAWVRVGCLHEHVTVYSICRACRAIAVDSLDKGEPMRCAPCLDGSPFVDLNGTELHSSSHPCRVHMEGLNGELGTPQTHPLES